MKWIISDVRQKLSYPPSILRLDGGYLSKETLSYIVEHHLYFCMAARYDWILAQGALFDESKWIRCDVKTRLYELGLSRVISTSPHTFRTILVEKEQEPFPGSKSKKKILRYGILERLPFSPSPQELYQFYHGRQTIEQFFKESTGPFNAGKLPSQKFRGNEAYLHLVTIAENCCVLFKKKFSHFFRNCSMETIRNRLIHHGASIEVANGVVRIRLNKSFPYQREVIDLLNELRQQVQIEEVGSIICGAIRSEDFRAQNN